MDSNFIVKKTLIYTIITISLFSFFCVNASDHISTISPSTQSDSSFSSLNLHILPEGTSFQKIRHMAAQSMKNLNNDITIESYQELQSRDDAGTGLNPDLSLEEPEIEWADSFGTSKDEIATCIKSTRDGGYIVAGYTTSNDGDLSENNGNKSFWVIKINSLGKTIWQKNYGRGYFEQVYDIVQTSDGGYLFVGGAVSPDVSGNVTPNTSDCLVSKLNPSGDVVWEKIFGGSLNDTAYSLTQTRDGGFILAGSSDSASRGLSRNHGMSDFWVIKFDLTGNIVWEQLYGGSDIDMARSIIQTYDGAYLIAGSTWSDNTGDVSGFHSSIGRNSDYWIVKLDQDGKILWQRSLGSSGNEEAMSIKEISAGGYIVAGWTSAENNLSSLDGDITGRLGMKDYWVVKITQSGKIAWQRCLGGSSHDAAYNIEQTPDNEYIVAGWTTSTDGNVTLKHGGEDAWIVRLNDDGKLIWQKCLGGKYDERAYAIALPDEKGVAVAGTSQGNDGDVTENHGGLDFWVVKLLFQGVNPSFSNNLTSETGSLLATSNPPGAEIWIDGSNTRNVSPSFIANISSGQHFITFSKPGYADLSGNITIQGGETTTKSVVLVLEAANLWVTSAPTGAMIIIDSINTGYKTPHLIPGVPVGLHNVVLTRENYNEWNQNIDVILRKTTDLVATLIPAEQNSSSETTIQ